jgi:thioredoxin-like negative regulator of GroEL
VYEELASSQGDAASPELRIALARTLVALGRPLEAAPWLAELPADAELDPRQRSEVRRLRRRVQHAQGRRP